MNREPEVLRLDRNEGARPPLDPITARGDLARRYPDASGLEAALAAVLAREAHHVVVTAGADDAIDRVMRAFAGPGRRVVVLDPTFEMIPTYAAQSGAEVVRVPWGEELNMTAVIQASLGASVVAIVTPDNPTGRVVPWSAVEQLAAALPEAIVLLDHAYVEYGDSDYTAAAARWANIVVTRTFSKAWGLAGLRVGYAIGASDVVARLRRAGGPYPVSGVSLALAASCLERPSYVAEHVDRVRMERTALATLLAQLGARVCPSQANFVFARLPRAAFVSTALSALGICVRTFDRPELADAMRITCPGDQGQFERLAHALRTVLRPDAVLFDMDGVLADVRGSYREAIRRTCAAFGLDADPEEVLAVKRAGNANDDFEVTRRVLAARGLTVPIEEIAEVFQRTYDDGLWATERLLVAPERLAALAEEVRLGVVTGRPRGDAERFLQTQGIAGYFDVVVCREDAPLKPNPAPVQLALRELSAQSAWMLGDTVDDVVAARQAGVLPVGVAAPGEFGVRTRNLLREAGAVDTLETAEEVMAWLR